MQKLTEWFNSQIGTKEVGENNVIYNTHFYGGPVNGSQYPWCMAFIWDGFRLNGMSNIFCGGQKTAYCPFVVGWAKANNQWVTSGYKEGDILLYDQDGDNTADHTGYCIGGSGNYYTAIEGNYMNSVTKVQRNISVILGAYRPNYPAETPAPVDTTTTAETPGTYTVQAGDSLWAIADKLLGDGSRYGEIMTANGLSSDMIHPGQVLKIPGSEHVTVSVTLKTELWETLQKAASIRGCSVDKVIEGILSGNN